MSLSIFPFCPFCWQNEMVKLANWQNEQNENVSVDFPILPILLAERNAPMVKLANWQNEQNKMSFSIFPLCPFCWQNEMVKLANWQNEQNENIFVDFLILSILLAERNGKVSKLAE